MKNEIKEFLENEENIEALKYLIKRQKEESTSKYNEALYEIKKQKIRSTSTVYDQRLFTKNLYVRQEVVGLDYKYFAKFKDYVFNDKQAKELFELCHSLYIAEMLR